jgi:hypothetical protein
MTTGKRAQRPDTAGLPCDQFVFSEVDSAPEAQHSPVGRYSIDGAGMAPVPKQDGTGGWPISGRGWLRYPGVVSPIACVGKSPR